MYRIIKLKNTRKNIAIFDRKVYFINALPFFAHQSFQGIAIKAIFSNHVSGETHKLSFDRVIFLTRFPKELKGQFIFLPFIDVIQSPYSLPTTEIPQRTNEKSYCRSSIPSKKMLYWYSSLFFQLFPKFRMQGYTKQSKRPYTSS